MKILITNRTMSLRNGAELYVRDLALELLTQGHRPMIYTSEMGQVADELKHLTVPVTDNLDDIGTRPDIIHGQHYITAIAALSYFGDVPMVNMCHGWRPWTEAPLIHPNVVGYSAVDDATRDRLALQHGIDDDQISVVYNFVDLKRFQPAAKPNDELSRILLFSNYVRKNSPYYRAAHEAAEQLGVQLDVVGSNTGSATTTPEKVLADYDVVLAQGRSALEAMAVGASVMICSSRAFGPLVRTDNVERMRELNFGIRTHTLPATAETITSQLTNYSARDAARVSSWIRNRVGVDVAVEQLVGMYEGAIETFDPASGDPILATRATGRAIALATREFHEVLAERNTLRSKARIDARGAQLASRAEGQRNDLRRQLDTAQSDLARERKKVAQLKQRVTAQQSRLDGLLGSRAIRAQRRVRSAPALRKGYRALLTAAGRR